jgi:putative ABC transport system permease protein
MRNVTFKRILAHKTRLALTAIAIMLGVAFISGTYILTDTLHDTFSVLVSNIYSKIDFQIRGVPQLAGDGGTRKELPQPLLAKVSRLPGVQAADGTVQGYAQFVARDGNPISTGGAPTLGVSFDPHPQVSTLRVMAGGPPKTSDDVVIDAGTAQQHGFKVGQRVRILLAGPSRTFTISGIAQFGTSTTWPGSPWPRSRCRPRSTCSTRSASWTRSMSSPGQERTRSPSARKSPRSCPPALRS